MIFMLMLCIFQIFEYEDFWNSSDSSELYEEYEAYEDHYSPAERERAGTWDGQVGQSGVSRHKLVNTVYWGRKDV